jgi:hypothetical protein
MPRPSDQWSTLLATAARYRKAASKARAKALTFETRAAELEAEADVIKQRQARAA